VGASNTLGGDMWTGSSMLTAVCGEWLLRRQLLCSSLHSSCWRGSGGECEWWLRGGCYPAEGRLRLCKSASLVGGKARVYKVYISVHASGQQALLAAHPGVLLAVGRYLDMAGATRRCNTICGAGAANQSQAGASMSISWVQLLVACNGVGAVTWWLVVVTLEQQCPMLCWCW
jgi:hypothetical protein